MRGWLAILALALVAAGCGSSAGKPATTSRPRPIASSQALELARVLVGDYQHGGSRLAGTYMVQGQRLDFTGAIDFRHNRGRLSLWQPSLPGSSARTFYWTPKLVLAQASPESSRYRASTPDPQGDNVAHLIALLDLLSAPLIDNVEQLQSVGIDYLGSQRGTDRFRYGQMLLSVRHATGLLASMAVSDPDGTTVSVRLLSHAPQHITLPPRSLWK